MPKKNYGLYSALILLVIVAVIGVGLGVKAYYGGNPDTVVENVQYWNEASDISQESLGALVGPDIYSDVRVFGSLNYKEMTTALAPTSIYATTTLLAENSGTTYYLSGSGTTITLPAINDGVNFKFQINGAADSGNFIIDSAEGDNIEGTLIVAGAVVDCASEDQINFVTDGENLGDYVEISSDGTQWLIGDSGTLTTGKMTCTDPS